MEPVRFVAYSDYLCPWCYVASRRLERLVAEDPAVHVEWRAYLLRPEPGRRRDLDAFRRYTESWRRPAAEPEAPEFRVWQGDEGPPSHSVPAWRVAKAAAALGEDAFRRLDGRLFAAYFAESRDISSDATLRALWREAGLPDAAFECRDDPALGQQVLDEHAEALAMGANGVPSLRLADRAAVVTGALPLESYRRWVEKERLRSSGKSRPTR